MNAERWKATVHVGGLAPMVTKEHIHDAFLPFGEIVEVSLPTTNPIQQQQNKEKDPNAPIELHRGFAYVEFEEAEDAQEAIDNMDQSELFGRILKVSLARVPKSAEEGLNSKTAVWEQVRTGIVLFIEMRHVLTLIAGGMASPKHRW
jgi:RNA recognition motif-containing protein